MIRQRIADWRRERRIRDLSRTVSDLMDMRCSSAARVYDAIRMAEIRGRSQKQVARMERKRGLDHA